MVLNRLIFRSLLSFLLVLLFAGCASLPAPRVAPEPDGALLEGCGRVEVLLASERESEALQLALDLASRYPESVDALRFVQSCRLAVGDDFGALKEAEERIRRAPHSGTAHYLLARLVTDADRAEALLTQAVRLDPALYWARLALAQVLARRESFHAARSALTAAETVAPGHPWTSLVAASVQARDRDQVGAGALLEETARRNPRWFRAWEALAHHRASVPGGEIAAREAFARAFVLAPGDRGLARAWRRALEFRASDVEWQVALTAVDGAEAAGESLTSAALHLRGAACLALGRAEIAEAELLRALEEGEDRTRVLGDIRMACFARGLYGRAVAIEDAWTPEEIRDDARNLRDVYRRFLARAAREAEHHPGDAGVLATLLPACRRAGWLREADLVAARRMTLLPGDAAAAEDAAETRRTLRFLDEFRGGWKGHYFDYSGGEDGGDLDGALAVLRNLSMHHLGVDLSDGIARRSFGVLGEMADSVRATDVCGRWFREHGLALVIGRAMGQPVEARLLRVLSERPREFRELLGRRFPVTVVVGEGLLVPSLREASGAVLGGFAAGDLIFVDLEGVGLWAAASRRAAVPGPMRDLALGIAPVPALSEEERLDARFPGRLPDRLAACMPRWRDPVAVLSDFLDAALTHELAHAADAHRYLPAFAHPFEVLRLLVRGGFGAGGGAAILEGDAEIVALAAAREPRAALSTLVSYLPAAEGGSPHVRGYHGVVRDLLQVLAERGVRPEGEDPVNLLRGLDTVSGEALRSAALEVCRRRGLVGSTSPPPPPLEEDSPDAAPRFPRGASAPRR